MARYLINEDGIIWLFRSEPAFREYAELRERGFDPGPEKHGAELLGPSVTNHPRACFKEWRKGEWEDKVAKLPGEGYDESPIDPDAVIALVYGAEHPSAPYPWSTKRFEEFGADNYIVSDKTGMVAARCRWVGGVTGFEMMAKAPTLLLEMAKEIQRLRSQNVELKAVVHRIAILGEELILDR